MGAHSRGKSRLQEGYKEIFMCFYVLEKLTLMSFQDALVSFPGENCLDVASAPIGCR
jgi:hypothetical protein